MKEVSLILKNNIMLTLEEFKILNNYSHPGKIWSVIYRYNYPSYIVTHRTVEYILDPETLTFFHIISDNILATWDTDITRAMSSNQEYQLKDFIFIKEYKRHL